MTASREVKGPVVLFDGVCNLCNRAVDFIIRHDRARQLRYGSLQSSHGRMLLEEAGLPPDHLDSIVVVDGGKVHRKSEAALHIARYLDAPWRFVTVLRLLPRRFRDGVYDWIANHRYAWFGKKDTCRVPTEGERELFLE